MKKTVSVFTLVFVLFFSFGNVFSVSAANGDEISIVVLGDSIARGYGLKNVEKERFSAVLAGKLSQHYSKVDVVNYGIDGITGKELSENLKKQPPKELGDCDYVLVSIGGNNILRSFSESKGIKDLASGIEPKVFIDYFRFLTSDDEKQKQALDYARETLNMLFKAANDAFEGESFKTLVDTASANLNNEIPEIISLIKQINPNAKIIVQTVYNPYDGLNIKLKAIDESLDLSSYGETAVDPLNTVIETLSAECGYTVAPVRDGFEASSQQLTNAGFDLLNKVFGVDPHPNTKGHALIAEIYYKIITEDLNA